MNENVILYFLKRFVKVKSSLNFREVYFFMYGLNDVVESCCNISEVSNVFIDN